MFLTNLQEDLTNMDKSKIQEYMESLLDWLTHKLFDVGIALVFLWLGFKVVKLIVNAIKHSFEKTGMEHSVEGFLLSLIRGVLYAIVVIMSAAIMGFQVTSLVTILGTASLAVGLALQGSLSNFAGGVLILIMKPFRVGDYIIENDKKCEGTVVNIDIFYTKLRTYDNKVIVIPNGNITASSIINLTAEEYRRLELNVGVAYDSDLKLVKDTLTEVITSSQYFENTMELNVYVDAFQDSSIKMGVRCYVKMEDYWPARWEILEKIKLTFDEKGIVIPFNQMEVLVKDGK
jgi:small conductance mechanosensitive channel